MGATGPPPEPRRLQAVKGRPGGKKQDGRPMSNPPQVVPQAPPKPSDLGEHGSWLWDLVTPELTRMTVLGQIDRTELEAYCRLYQLWRETEPRARQWMPMIDRLSRLATNLGLTPTSRLRMSIPERKSDDDLFSVS